MTKDPRKQHFDAIIPTALCAAFAVPYVLFQLFEGWNSFVYAIGESALVVAGIYVALRVADLFDRRMAERRKSETRDDDR